MAITTVRKIRRFGARAPLFWILALLLACEQSDITVEATVLGGGSLGGGVVRLVNDLNGETLDVTGTGSFGFQRASLGYAVRVDSAPAGFTCRLSKNVRPSIPGGTPGRVARKVYLRCAPDGLDTDGDGLSDGQELELGTNPSLPDTDGDGYPDDEELARFDGYPRVEPDDDLATFNPRVADLPRLEIELAQAPEIDIVATQTVSGDRTVGTSHDQSLSQGTVSSFGSEASRVIAFGHTVKTAAESTFGGSVEIGLDPSVSANWEASISEGVENTATSTNGSTYSWSRDQSQENVEVYGQYRDETAGQSVTVNGATLTVRVRARNASHIAYDLQNLTLAAYHFDPKNPADITYVGQPLVYAGGVLPSTNLPAGGTSAVWTFRGDIELDDAEALLRSSRQIAVVPATFLIVGKRPDGSIGSLGIEGTDVENETATIAIDFGFAGGGVEDRFRVAVDNGDGSDWISAADALGDVLGYGFFQQRGDWRYEDDLPAEHTQWGLLRLTHPNPTEMLDFPMSSDESRYWLVAHTRSPGFGGGAGPTRVYSLLTDAYDLYHIELRKGDTLSLVLVGDRDRDGLPDRTELELGTDRLSRDSDGDGIEDARELWGYTLTCPALPDGTLEVPGTDPLLADSDGDGMPDGEDCDPVQIVDLALDCGPESDLGVGDTVACSVSFGGSAADSCKWSVRDGDGVVLYEETSPFCDDLILPGTDPLSSVTDRVATLDVSVEVTPADPPMTPSTATTRLDVWNGPNRVFVDSEKGDNINGSGTPGSPYQTILKAFNMSNGDVYVMTREGSPYTYGTVLEVPAGRSLFGGFVDTAEPGEAPVWVRQPRSHKTRLEIVNDGVALRFGTVPDGAPVVFSGFELDASGSVAHDGVALEVGGDHAGSMHGTFVLEDNQITSGPGAAGTTASRTGRSSYGVYAANLDTLALAGNAIRAGAGGKGLDGTGGANGGNGARGGDATSTDWGLGGWGPGGRGGHSGWSGNPGGNGATGCDGQGGARGGAGGSGGAGGLQRAWPHQGRIQDAGPGTHGAPGDPGPATPPPTFAAARFVASDGNDGACGGAGGGGGGGGAETVGAWEYGSGGGAGGAGGSGGKGGGGGGASIALAVFFTDTVASTEDALIASDAGDGGQGGYGGAGGVGGSGGLVPNPYGGRGGPGANAGRGGDGSGGHGGASYGVVLDGENVLEATFQGSGIAFGAAGSAGTSSGYFGTQGSASDIFLPVSEGVSPVTALQVLP